MYVYGKLVINALKETSIYNLSLEYTQKPIGIKKATSKIKTSLY